LTGCLKRRLSHVIIKHLWGEDPLVAIIPKDIIMMGRGLVPVFQTRAMIMVVMGRILLRITMMMLGRAGIITAGGRGALTVVATITTPHTLTRALLTVHRLCRTSLHKPIKTGWTPEHTSIITY